MNLRQHAECKYWFSTQTCARAHHTCIRTHTHTHTPTEWTHRGTRTSHLHTRTNTYTHWFRTQTCTLTQTHLFSLSLLQTHTSVHMELEDPVAEVNPAGWSQTRAGYRCENSAVSWFHNPLHPGILQTHTQYAIIITTTTDTHKPNGPLEHRFHNSRVMRTQAPRKHGHENTGSTTAGSWEHRLNRSEEHTSELQSR